MKTITTYIVLVFILSLEGIGQVSYSDSLKSMLTNSDDSTKVRIYSKLSDYFLDSIPDQSVSFADQAYLLSNKNRWLWGEADAENLMGIAYYNMAEYSKSLTYFKRSLNKRKLIGTKEDLAASYNNIAMVYLEYNNYNLAIECINNSMAINLEEGLEVDVADNLHNLAAIYWEKNDYQTAIDYTQEALIIYEGIGKEDDIADTYNNLGNLYSKVDKPGEAREYLERALERYTMDKDRKGIATAKLNIAELLYTLNRYNEAYLYLSDALSIAQSLQDLDLLVEIHENIFKYFKQKRNYTEALKHHKLFEIYKDSIYNQLQNDIILEEQVKLDSENKRKEIQAFKKDYELQDVEIQKQKSVGVFLIILMGVSFSTIFLFNVLFKSRKKTNDLIKEKNVQLYYSNQELEVSKQELTKLNHEKDRFFSIIAHDLISPFTSFISLSEILRDNTNSLDEKDIKKYSGWIFTSAKNIYNLVDNLLQWSRSQSGKLNYSPKYLNLNKIVQETVALIKPSADDKNIRILTPVSRSLKVYADADILSTILRNLLNNAVKFTDKDGTISVLTNDTGKMVEVSVTDNGIGIKEDDLNKLFQLDRNFTTKGTIGEEGNGLGLILCKEFVQAIGGTIHVKSKVKSGSTFKFTIPKIPVQIESRKG